MHKGSNSHPTQGDMLNWMDEFRMCNYLPEWFEHAQIFKSYTDTEDEFSTSTQVIMVDYKLNKSCIYRQGRCPLASDSHQSVQTAVEAAKP